MRYPLSVLLSAVALVVAGCGRESSTNADAEKKYTGMRTTHLDARVTNAGAEKQHVGVHATHLDGPVGQWLDKAIATMPQLQSEDTGGIIAKTKAYCRIAGLCAKASDLRGARETLRVAESILAGWAPGQTLVRNYCTIAKARAAQGDIDESRATFDLATSSVRDMKYAEYGGACLIIVLSQTETGDLAGAEVTIERIVREKNLDKETELRQLLYSWFARGQALAGDIDGAKATASTIERETMKNAARIGIVGALGKAGRFSEAETMAEAATAAELQRNMYIELAKARARSGDATQAAEMFELAKKAVRSFETWKLYYVVEAQLEVRLFEAAENTAVEIEKASSRNKCYDDIAGAVAEAGDIESAKAIAAKITPDQREGFLDSYVGIVKAHAKAGNIDAAKAVLENLDRPYWKKQAIEAIATALAAAGDSASIDQWAESLDDPEERISVYLGAAEGLIEKEESKGEAEK